MPSWTSNKRMRLLPVLAKLQEIITPLHEMSNEDVAYTPTHIVSLHELVINYSKNTIDHLIEETSNKNSTRMTQYI